MVFHLITSFLLLLTFLMLIHTKNIFKDILYVLNKDHRSFKLEIQGDTNYNTFVKYLGRGGFEKIMHFGEYNLISASRSVIFSQSASGQGFLPKGNTV